MVRVRVQRNVPSTLEYSSILLQFCTPGTLGFLVLMMPRSLRYSWISFFILTNIDRNPSKGILGRIFPTFGYFEKSNFHHPGR